jgi:hypothetical protein
LTFYVAHFSTNQSIVLSVLLALILPAASEAIEERKFTPFGLRIEPNYAAILVDVGLLECESAWWTLLNSWEEQRRSESEQDAEDEANRAALRTGFGCYVLSFDRESGTYAVAWTRANRYSSQIDYTVEIDCITKGSFGSHPELRIKPWKGGYRISLNVSETWFEKGWWEAIQSKLQFNKKDVWTSRDFLTGTCDVPLAVIPPEEFLLHYFNAGSLRARKAALAKNGWTEEESNWELQALGAPVELSHRYVKIAHREI